MAKINLLPWREERKEQRKKKFIFISILAAVFGVVLVFAAWSFFEQKLNDQQHANQVITESNQQLDQKLQALNGLQEQRNAIIDRMKLIQGLQAQRPVTVRLVDELVRVIPDHLYLTKVVRQGDQFSIEGKAESPNVVAEFMRKLGASPWYRNVFMSSFVAADDKTNAQPSSVVPRVEEGYGNFVVTADLGQIAQSNNAQEAAEPQGAQP
ncbi:PilN domain-containing protein [Acinetobacter sp. MD2(2019)]|uniref:PilN domain-containing protein n=1 Tax=Acinetobacter sp. MD2(2019) TaxID=2605273 RepID=UPI002D1EBABD|nr:PilN domain-containing protein [Acinetobacter sp. MD2(2019)]MEB3753206.1 PilN domain-containing protein [Acinetobacter sp. MD2(2019)]